MKQNKILQNWEKATQEITDYFLEKYFNEKDYKPDWYWIGDEIGYVIDVNQFFFSLEDIVNFVRYNYSKKDMFDYYDLRLEAQIKEKPFANIENWRKLKI